VLERPHLNDAGVVDQDIDRAGARDDLLHELLGLVAVTDVARYDVDVDAARDEVLARALELGAVARGNRHPGALTPELAGDQQSESARSARDEHGAAAKVYGAGRAEPTRQQSRANRQRTGGQSRLLFGSHVHRASKWH